MKTELCPIRLLEDSDRGCEAWKRKRKNGMELGSDSVLAGTQKRRLECRSTKLTLYTYPDSSCWLTESYAIVKKKSR